jgi:hypothetical protein
VQIASASLASFFPLLRNGRTTSAAMIRTVCPCRVSAARRLPYSLAVTGEEYP